MTVQDQMAETLVMAGFSVVPFELEDRKFLDVKHSNFVNPAEMRTRAAEALSKAGFSNYYLKESYFFGGSKHPHRTDEHGGLEVELIDGSQRMVITKVETKQKIRFFKEKRK